MVARGTHHERPPRHLRGEPAAWTFRQGRGARDGKFWMEGEDVPSPGAARDLRRDVPWAEIPRDGASPGKHLHSGDVHGRLAAHVPSVGLLHVADCFDGTRAESVARIR